MKKINQKCIAVLGSLLLLACGAASAHGQPRKLKTQPDQIKKAPESKVVATPGDPDSRLLGVPNVVGLQLKEAADAILEAGLKWKVTYLKKPDLSVRRGHVSATVPAAGLIVTPGSEIELQIPGAANKVGQVTLSLTDVGRHLGFDLDEGRFEVINSGADILLRRVGEDSIVPDMYPIYKGAGTGTFLEGSDGAALVDVRRIHRSARFVGDLGVGSYPVYQLCETALKPAVLKLFSRRPLHVAELWPLKDEEAAACVRTSKGQMAVVYFRWSLGSDQDPHGIYYTFLWALFENEPPRPVERAPVKRIGNKPNP